jgi:hypothetical protein
MENEEDIDKKTKDLESKIKSLKGELENIQEICTHAECVIKFNKKKSVKKYCKSCDKELGYASDREREDFLKGRENKKS